MQGTVEKIESKKVNTQYGVKTAYTVVIDGKFYSTFKNPGVSEGDHVEFDYRQNGKYKNLNEIHPATAFGYQSPAENKQSNDEKKQEYIIRQSSITRAIETLSATEAETDLAQFVKKVLQLSELYTDFVLNGITDEIFNNSLFEVKQPKETKKEAKK